MIANLLAALLLQTAAPACTETARPPAGLEAWSTVAAISTASVEPGKTASVQLSSADKVKFALAPERPPAAGSFAGVYQVTVARAGTYRIALEAGAWIDLVRDGKSLTSVAHMEGPPCSGIRKIVDFDLAAGSYTLQLSGAKVATMRVLIAAR